MNVDIKDEKNKQVDIESLENKAFISAYGNNYVIIDKKKYYNLLFFYNDQIKIINEKFKRAYPLGG